MYHLFIVYIHSWWLFSLNFYLEDYLDALNYHVLIEYKNDTSFIQNLKQIEEFFLKHKKVHQIFEEFSRKTNTTLTSEFKTYILKVFTNFKAVKDYTRIPKHDEKLGEVFRSSKSNPKNQKLYRKEIYDTLSFKEFLDHFIKPFPKTKENKITLKFNKEGKDISLFIDASNQDFIKALKIIQLNLKYIRSVTFIFCRFEPKISQVYGIRDYFIGMDKAHSIRIDEGNLKYNQPIIRTNDFIDLTFFGKIWNGTKFSESKICKSHI